MVWLLEHRDVTRTLESHDRQLIRHNHSDNPPILKWFATSLMAEPQREAKADAAHSFATRSHLSLYCGATA